MSSGGFRISHAFFLDNMMSPTITFSQFNSPWVSGQGMQVSSTGGDSSCSWVAVRALGHNLSRDAGDTFNSPC